MKPCVFVVQVVFSVFNISPHGQSAGHGSRDLPVILVVVQRVQEFYNIIKVFKFHGHYNGEGIQLFFVYMRVGERLTFQVFVKEHHIVEGSYLTIVHIGAGEAQVPEGGRAESIALMIP